MTNELKDFEESMASMRDEYITRHNKSVDLAKEQHGARNIAEKKIKLKAVEVPEARRAPVRRHTPSFTRTGYIVKLGVRKSRMSLDTLFEHVSDKLSELEARLDAERAAREAGYPIIGYLYSMEKVDQ